MKKLKEKVRSFLYLFIRTETITESKEKWDKLAQKNARYFVYSDKGENVSEEEYRKSGDRDYTQYIKEDHLIARGADKKVLEIGCGTGRMTEFFAPDFGEVYGVDIAKDMIVQGKERLSRYKNIVLRETDGVSYPFADNFFDLVFSYTVFQHMPASEVIRKNLEEVARVLKPNALAKIQLRGTPAKKGQWYYGVHFDKRGAQKLIQGLPLDIIKTKNEGERYFWFWFKKSE